MAIATSKLMGQRWEVSAFEGDTTFVKRVDGNGNGTSGDLVIDLTFSSLHLSNLVFISI